MVCNIITPLGALIPASGSSVSTTVSSTNSSTNSAAFTRNLTIGSVGADVKLLQHFLNTHGFIVASSGNGSTGHESTYFGQATHDALIKFQIAENISPASGYFGVKTRAVIQSI